MDGITFGQLLAANGVLIATIIVGLAVTATTLVVRRHRRFRRAPTRIDGVRIECQGAVLDDDLVIEQNWRITVLMTNVTRKPVPVPVLGSRAIVTAGRKQYSGTVYLEREARELNPGDEIVAWVLVRLAGGESPRRVEVELNSSVRVRAAVSTSPESVVAVSPGSAA